MYVYTSTCIYIFTNIKSVLKSPLVSNKLLVNTIATEIHTYLTKCGKHSIIEFYRIHIIYQRKIF